MVLGILYGYIEPLEDQKRLAFLVFVRIVERIQDKPHAHGGASLTDTLLLYQVPHVDKVDEHGREHSLILRVIVTNNAGELAVVDSDGFEQGRRQRVVRIPRRVRTARLTARYISTKGFAETSSGRLSAGADGCAGCGAGCLSFIIAAGVEIL